MSDYITHGIETALRTVVAASIILGLICALIGGGVVWMLLRPCECKQDLGFSVTDIRGNVMHCEPWDMSDKLFGEMLWAENDEETGALKLRVDLDMFGWCRLINTKGRP